VEFTLHRDLTGELIKWKKRKDKKPLILTGARQVGKTWLMRDFGETHYKRQVYISFDGNERMARLFSGDFDTARIISGLQIEADCKIIPGETLVIFDEIQQCPKALSSLKYFCENAPQYDIIAAGSMLGLSVHGGDSFPVGKVEFLNLYPLSYFEFLNALGKDDLLALIENLDFEMIKTFKDKFIDQLRLYFFVGGMPEAVLAFCRTNDLFESRNIQKQILTGYEQDFSKHIPLNMLARVRMAWNSIPAQLAKENKKFVYGLLRQGARAKEYETSLAWLSDCGLAYKISRINKAALPLKAYEDIDAFKLFGVDVGLLAALCELDARTMLEGSLIFEEFKGALTEQYVLQQLKTAFKNMPVYYWANETGGAEVDFVVQSGRNIIPVEAKSGINLQAKSLKTYREKYMPKIAVRTAITDFKIDGGFYNVPLYMIGALQEIIKAGLI
jgi:hypothetical protein